jgi:O-antigen ligase
VNTGLAGGVSMLAFVGCGAAVAFRILRKIREIGCDTRFRRLCTVVASLYLTHTFVFIFLHGDSQFAMLLFGLQTGLLIACHRHLYSGAPIPDEV